MLLYLKQILERVLTSPKEIDVLLVGLVVEYFFRHVAYLHFYLSI